MTGPFPTSAACCQQYLRAVAGGSQLAVAASHTGYQPYNGAHVLCVRRRLTGEQGGVNGASGKVGRAPVTFP